MILQAICFCVFFVNGERWGMFWQSGRISEHVFDDKMEILPHKSYTQMVCVNLDDPPIMFLGDQNASYVSNAQIRFTNFPKVVDSNSPGLGLISKVLCIIVYLPMLLFLLGFTLGPYFIKSLGPPSKLKARTHKTTKKLSNTTWFLLEYYIDKEGLIPILHKIIQSYIYQPFYLNQNFSKIPPQPLQFA